MNTFTIPSNKLALKAFLTNFSNSPLPRQSDWDSVDICQIVDAIKNISYKPSSIQEATAYGENIEGLLSKEAMQYFNSGEITEIFIKNIN